MLDIFFFSPTGGTRKVAEAAASSWEGQKKWIGLGRRDFPFGMSVPSDDTCIIAVPSFGGRVPAMVATRVASLKGNGAKTMLLAVFGSRGYDDTLIELYDVATKAGFNVIGAGAVVAEHSLARRIGAGRPDGRDLAEVADFARQATAHSGQGTLNPPGHRPYRSPGRLGVYPAPNRDCLSCTMCADICPTQAIQKKRGMPVIEERCIGCMACVAKCTAQCRRLPAQAQEEIAQNLLRAVPGRARNEFYLAS